MVRAAIAASLTSGKKNIAAALGDVILHGANQAKHPWGPNLNADWRSRVAD